MSDIDLTLALQLQAQFEEEERVRLLKKEVEERKAQENGMAWHGNKAGSIQRGQRKIINLDEPHQKKLSISLIDSSWELVDPNPDVHALFLTFNHQFFWGRLEGVEVKWSPRMTLCAGVCSYEGRGGLCSVRLSVPLLKLRPRKDLIETLLHEMIHAYLFVTANNRDRDGHGPEFHKHMYRINNLAGTKISVYHSFHDEVDVYRQHVWRCDGPCRSRRPYFGLVKRAMNRAPGPRDPWWQRHQQSCGGSYTKIQEPEGYGAKKNKGVKEKTGNSGDIRKFMEFSGKGNSLIKKIPPPPSQQDSKTKPSILQQINRTSTNVKENDKGFKSTNDVYKSKNVTQSKGKSMKTDDFLVRDKKNNDQFKGGVVNGVHGNVASTTTSLKRRSEGNTSKSNIHGFGGNSPVKKKSNYGGKSHDKGSGQSMRGKGDKVKDAKHDFGNKGGFGTSASMKRGGGGGGLAMRGRGGSRTITVGGRASTSTEATTDLKNKKPSHEISFQGQGICLGGSGRGVSRLLDLQNSSPHPVSPAPSSPGAGCIPGSSSQASTSLEGRTNAITSEFDDQISSIETCNGDDENPLKCPLCNKVIPEAEMTQHLDDCLGMFSEGMNEDDFESNEVIDTQGFKTQTSLTRDDDECMIVDVPYEKNIENSGETKVESVDSNGHDRYPCPVCGNRYSLTEINSHLDSHF